MASFAQIRTGPSDTRRKDKKISVASELLKHAERRLGNRIWHGFGLLLVMAAIYDGLLSFAGTQSAVYSPAGLVFYSVATTTIAAFFLVNIGLKNRPGIYYSALFAVMLALIWALEGGLKAHGLGGEFEADIAITIGFLGAGFGFFVAESSIDPGRDMPRTRMALKILIIISLLQIPIIWISSWQPMANVANILLILMFASQIIPARTSRTHDERPRITHITAAVIGALLTVVFFGLFLAGAAEELLPSPAMFRFLFAAVAIPTMAGVVAALIDMRRAHDAALLASVEAARNDAKTSAALLELEKNYTRARDVAAVRTRQLSTASHDIRQPLASLRADIDALRHSNKSGDLDRLENVLDHIDQLSEDLSLLARRPIEAGLHGEIESENVGVALLFETLDKMFASEAQSLGIELKMEPVDYAVKAPPLVLMRMLSNLISNALAHAGASLICVSADRADTIIRFEVTDDGNGFEGEDTDWAFRPGTTGAGSDGSGLGLSIVRELSETYALPIEVTTEQGKGTCISVRVPMA